MSRCRASPLRKFQHALYLFQRVILTDRHGSVQPSPGRIAGAVMAAGKSRRFGTANKLLVEIEGEKLVHRTVRVFLEAGLDPVVLVVGHQLDTVAHSVADLSATAVENPHPSRGLSSSIVVGVRSLPLSVQAVVLSVADQPRLETATITALTARYWKTRRSAVAARYGGQLATPVLFDRSLFPLLLKLTGDAGAASVVKTLGSEVEWVDFDAGLATDIDTLEDLSSLQSEA